MSYRRYAYGAPFYVAAGWCPVPARERFPPGPRGPVPDVDQISRWAAGPEGDWNLCVRLPDHVVGIDVDCYRSTRDCAAVIAEWEGRLGALPATSYSTARVDGSKVLVFRVPAGRSFVDDLDGSVSVLHPSTSRCWYVTCWPTIHARTGWPYFWHNVGGPAGPPAVESLAALPEPWVTALTKV